MGSDLREGLVCERVGMLVRTPCRPCDFAHLPHTLANPADVDRTDKVPNPNLNLNLNPNPNFIQVTWTGPNRF